MATVPQRQLESGAPTPLGRPPRRAFFHINLNTVLLLAVLVLLAYWLFFKPETNRFIPLPDQVWMALDSKTGKTCKTIPPSLDDGGLYKELPNCSDLR